MDLALSLRALAPIALRSGRDAQHSSTLPYIPGATLLGALASAHQQLAPSSRDQFAEFFLRGRLQVGNAYPADFANPALQDWRSAVSPLPVTARTCKRWAGFRFQSSPEAIYHGVHDQLAAWTVFALSAEQAVQPLQAAAHCAACGESMDAMHGFYRRGGSAGEYGKSAERLALLTHAGINRATGAVEQGILYTNQVLASGTRFSMRAQVDDAISRSFRAFVEEADDTGLLRAGSSRTRGLGLLKAEIRELDDEPDARAALEARLKAFDERVRSLAQQARVRAAHRLYVPITLTSDVLLRDHLLRWRTRIDADVLSAAGIAGGELLYHAARVRRIMGWNAVQGLPHADAFAIAMGSVFVFGFAREPGSATLLALQRTGLGLRRDAGFGCVVVADPFHSEVQNA